MGLAAMNVHKLVGKKASEATTISLEMLRPEWSLGRTSEIL